jgi:hypothetical protein
MPQVQYDKKRIEDEIKAGRPERYFDYISKICGKTFETGSIQALETFRELLRQDPRAWKRAQHASLC